MRLVQCSLTVRSVSISWDSGTIVCCLSTIVRSVVQFMSLRFRIHSAIYISTIRPIHTSNRTGGGGFSFRVGAQGRYQRLLIVPRWNCFFLFIGCFLILEITYYRPKWGEHDAEYTVCLEKLGRKSESSRVVTCAYWSASVVDLR